MIEGLENHETSKNVITSIALSVRSDQGGYRYGWDNLGVTLGTEIYIIIKQNLMAYIL